MELRCTRRAVAGPSVLAPQSVSTNSGRGLHRQTSSDASPAWVISIRATRTQGSDRRSGLLLPLTDRHGSVRTSTERKREAFITRTHLVTASSSGCVRLVIGRVLRELLHSAKRKGERECKADHEEAKR